jgi:hypothetical protein
MAVVLFLDFDGVTHPEPCYKQGCFSNLHLIEAVLREFPAVELVISSSWRDHHTLDELRDMFSPDIGQMVVGVTPSIKNPSSDWLPGSTTEHEREWEIETWMKANRPWGTPWMAIDDRAHWFRENSPNLLLTKSAFGFHPDQQSDFRSMLQERESWL